MPREDVVIHDCRTERDIPRARFRSRRQPWRLSPACQPRTRAQRPRPQAPQQPTTQLSSLSLPLLIRSAREFRPIPFSLRTEPQISPGGDRSVRVLTALTRKFRPVTAPSRQAKNGGNCRLFRRIRPLSTERWQLLRECHKLGPITALLPAPKDVSRGQTGRVFHTPAFANKRLFGPTRIDVFKPPPPFCGWPPGASRPARRSRRSPDGSGPSAWRSAAPACRRARYSARRFAARARPTPDA